MITTTNLDCKTQPNIVSTVETVTPFKAKLWLETKNLDCNRNISDTVVRDYANTMKRGEWIIAESLKFDMEDVLIDGQHRLKAVCLANIPIDFLVARGYERTSAKAFDCGKNRNLANRAQIDGESWVKPRHTSVFKNLFYAIGENGRILKKMTREQQLNAILTLKESYPTALYKLGSQCGKQITSAQVHSVITRAYYSPKSEIYTVKGAKIPFTTDLLKDFLLLLYGYSYHSDHNLFSQVLLDPSAPTRLRDAFRLNDFKVDLGSGSSLAKAKFMYAQTSLFKYLSNANVKNLSIINDNLFPVSWIDDLTFDKPEPS